MKLSEIIDSGSLSRLNRDNIRPGDIFEISLTQENGITPKPGDTSRNKYFVVLGFRPRSTKFVNAKVADVPQI